MASALFISKDQAQAEALAIARNTGGFGGAHLLIYSDTTTKPANANLPIPGGAVVLADFTLPSFETLSPNIVEGVITFPSIPSVTAGAVGGTASYFRIVGAGNVVVCDGNVGLAGSSPDLVLNSVNITPGATVSITSFTYTVVQ